jgi:CheY-like chemotaxis protein
MPPIRNAPKMLRILVIEDNAIIAMLLEQTLIGMGFEVCAVEATEVGAVAAAALCKPDLLIADAHLREGNGISAVERILRIGFVPHIFVSGDNLTPETLSPRAILLGKPYDELELAQAILRACPRGPSLGAPPQTHCG